VFAFSSARAAVEAAKKINLSRARRRSGPNGTGGGRPPKPDRPMVTAFWYVLRTGCPWRDVPGCFGSWQSVYTRWRRWCASGLWARLLQVLARRRRGSLRHLDCSHIKVHHHGLNPVGGQPGQAIGHSRGGANTKLAAVVDAGGRAIALALAPGQRHDSQAVQPLLSALAGGRVVADKAFAFQAFYHRLRRHRARACLPPKRRERLRAPFHRGYYRCRHKVENFFCRIKRFRRIATRYDKLASSFLSFVQLAASFDWLTHKV
jgi:transposase